MDTPRIQPITPEQTHALRHAVLRPHQPIREMAYPGDDDPLTAHLGAVDTGGAVVGIVSLYHEPSPADPAPGDWRLRGMAVRPARRGIGLGTALVAAGLGAVRREGGRRVWCNARTPAVGFYERQGFTRVGEPFDLPGIGEHYVMRIAVETTNR